MDLPQWQAFCDSIFAGCRDCRTLTHCHHWHRCLHVCTPEDLGLSPVAGEALPAPSASPVNDAENP